MFIPGMTKVITTTLLSAVSLGTAAQCTDDVTTIVHRIGEEATFCGVPTGIKCARPGGSEPVYIDFGGTYPDEVFSVLLPAGASDPTCRSLHARLDGHRLRVTGKVISHQGKAAIMVDHPSDIMVEDPLDGVR